MPNNISQLFVSADDTILKTLQVIDKAGAQGTKIALVVDEAKRLSGIVSDGDIRRALLKKPCLKQLVSDIMTVNYISVDENATRASVLNKMKACDISHIPVLNGSGKVVGLHTLRDFIKSKSLPNIAVVMAGGRGRRLHPITEVLPKPMVKVAGTPILEHIIHHLVGSSIKKIYISVNYMSKIIEDYFGDGSLFGCRIAYLKEKTPLGTAGALSLLPKKIKNDFLLLNGDLVTQFNVKNIFEKHKKAKNKVTIGARNHLTQIPYGVLEVDEDKVSALTEKPELSNLINAGIYVLAPEILNAIPENQIYDATDIIENCFKNNERVGYHLLEEDWIDVGEPEQLANARGGVSWEN